MGFTLPIRLGMARVITTKNRCPACGGRFPTSKAQTPIACPTCRTTPQKYYLILYYQGSHKIHGNRIGRALYCCEQATRLLDTIRAEIDTGRFDPDFYLTESNRSFGSFWEKFLVDYSPGTSTWDKLNAIGQHHFSILFPLDILFYFRHRFAAGCAGGWPR
ncbi:MAG: hypothetical protein AB1641_21030 [Thermodesulfobacteriota bacterium]